MNAANRARRSDGPALGAALRAAQEAWVAAGFPGDGMAVLESSRPRQQKARRDQRESTSTQI